MHSFHMKKSQIIILFLFITSCKQSSGPGVYQPVNDSDVENITQISIPDENIDNSDFKLSCEEARFVSLLNLYRKVNNLNTVEVSKSGVESTRWHAQDMINKNYFSHTEPSGRTFNERSSVFGYSAWAENIAAGNVSASATFCQWKNSPGHNTNMLGARHLSIGIGNASGGFYRSYWSNNFGPAVSDILNEPYSNESCLLPNSLPSC